MFRGPAFIDIFLLLLLLLLLQGHQALQGGSWPAWIT
jgi:hypothetical protein